MAAEINCIQRRNSGAGFVKEHGTGCALDRSNGIDHGLASHHLNLGHWCGNVCSECANKTEGSGEKKRRKYKPEQVSEGTFQAVVIVAPRFVVNRSDDVKPQSTTVEEKENTEMPKTKTTKKKATRAKRVETEKITDAKAAKLLDKAKAAGVSDSSQTLARWFRTQGFAMSVNRISRIAQERTAAAKA